MQIAEFCEACFKQNSAFISYYYLKNCVSEFMLCYNHLMKKFLECICLCLGMFLSLNVRTILAQEVNFEAEVTAITDEKTIIPANSDDELVVQNLELQILSGERSGEIMNFTTSEIPLANAQRYQIGDKIIISGSSDENLYIADFVRRDPLLLLTIVFVVAAILVGRWQGFTSLLSLAVSFLVIFLFVLPKIAAGSNPVIIVILASLIIIPVIFLFSHGWNKKTLVAMVATLIAMVVTGILIVLFVNLTNLTGFSSEEAGFLQAMNPDVINLKNLLIAGMLVATLGVLDDITISQAAIVAELKKANANLTFWQLYRRAMKVGRDHIASMINTLVLAYAGASFPLLLMFIQSNQGFGTIVNYEIVADEIVRTLTGSLGLILAVPLTTLLAAAWEQWQNEV